jgi:NADPH:quinone reductase-like Zn-dependent oxidoreductase
MLWVMSRPEGAVPARPTAGTARAYWTLAPGRGEIREEPLPSLAPGEALVRALHSGVSRGSETLVHRGQVPAEVADAMRAPLQEGDLDGPGPVKYGYLSVGVVEDGPDGWVGRRVFCLHPHQDRYVVPVSALVPVPDDVPSARAVLGGTVETAVNAVWDAGPRWGDRVAVVGAGMVGACVAALLRDHPLEELVLVDPDPARTDLATALGVPLVHPDDVPGGLDLVVHCSATPAGLATGLSALGFEGVLVELSWYASPPTVPLGGAFHARRLTIMASQVGAVAPARRARRSTSERLGLALAELADPVYDLLLTDRCDFADLPETLDHLARPGTPGMCTVVDYP